MKIDARFAILVSAAIISVLIVLGTSVAEGAERKQAIAQLAKELEREAAGREAAPEWIIKLGRHVFDRGLDLGLPVDALKELRNKVHFDKALQDKLQKMDDEARLQHIDQLIDDVRTSVPAEPKKDDEAKRKAAEVPEREGRGDFAKLPAGPMGLVAEFLPQPEVPKRLVLEHENVDATLADPQGNVYRATSDAFAYNNTKLRAFIEDNERLRSLFHFPPRFIFLPESAPLLADYDFIEFEVRDDLPRGYLRVRDDAFVAAGRWLPILVTGVQNGPTPTDLKPSSEGGTVFALARKSSGEASGAFLAILVDKDPVRPWQAVWQPASFSMRTALIDGDGRERLSIPFTEQRSWITFGKELQLTPLGFGTNSGAFMAWNKIVKGKKISGEFGYYDIAKHKFFPTQHFSSVDQSRTPQYSMKPYSTLCVVHDQKSKLTIFDPRFVGAQLTLAMPDLWGRPLRGVCLKWNDKSKLTHVALLTAVVEDSRVNIYKVEDDVSADPGKHSSVTARYVTKGQRSVEPVGDVWPDYLFGTPSSAESLPGGGREGAIEAPY